MLSVLGTLLCYKQTEIDSEGKLKFFLDKHSTKEGTWGLLRRREGDIDFVFLNGSGAELKRVRINKENPELVIPPASWHKIEPVSDQFNAALEFYCAPHRYFNKKYGLGMVHSDLLSIYQTYLSGSDAKNNQVLDVGCGSGRNLLYFAQQGYSITGMDINKSAIDKINELSQKESLAQVHAVLHDLHQPLNLANEFYNLIFSTVSIQFLNAERIPSLLEELQRATAIKGFNYLVFPIKAESYVLPESFTFLPEKEELYHFYQDSGWSIIEYKETTGLLHRLDEHGRPIQGVFGHLLAQKICDTKCC
ncbi:SAM-dependent methyltransferase TehB [uncultured Legionella sp.]|uniref:SAM-dependent methyltransferase TehB n=1 Tax=uncultured Legionella sp. TaxID=210934 RepID=UPI00262BBB11|nr:SAM-dependent methyltransferase TehB [uncultured Legionella sp.]